MRSFATIGLFCVLVVVLSAGPAFAGGTYTIAGKFESVRSGTDPLGMVGFNFTVVATLGSPTSLNTTASKSEGLYNDVTSITLSTTKPGLTGPFNCSAPGADAFITDNVTGNDGIGFSDCTVLNTWGAALGVSPGKIVTGGTTPVTSGSATGTVSYFLLGARTDLVVSNTTVSGSGDSQTVTTNPTSISKTAEVGSTTPLTQNVSFSVSPAWPRSYTTSKSTTSCGSGWLTVSPSSGNTSTQVTVTTNPSGLSAGTCEGSVTVDLGQGLTKNIPVTLNVTGPTQLTVNPTSLAFTHVIGASAPASKNIGLTSNNSVSFTAAASTTSGGGWLSVSPTSGTASTTSQNLAVSINTASLTSEGTFNGKVTITAAGATNSPLEVPVSITVSKPALNVSPATLAFSYTIGSTPPANKTFSLSTDAGSASFTAAASTTSGGSWLSVSPTSGTATTSPQNLTVSVNTAGLTTPGTYNGKVTVTSASASNSPREVTVSITVSAPTVTVSPSSLNFGFQVGGSNPPAQNISVSTSPAVAFTASASGGNWLSVSPTGGNGSANLSVSVNPAGLSAGTYNGTITVKVTGAADKTVAVTLTVSSVPTLTVSPGQLTFSYQVGGSNPASQNVSVTATVASDFTVSTTGGAWLSVSPLSGTTNRTLTVSVNPSGLAPGTFGGTITVTAPNASNSPQTVNVTLNVTEPVTITAAPTALSFSAQLGGAAPPAQNLRISATQPTAFNATVSGGNWLSVTPVSGTTPRTLSVSANPTGLAAGTYNATITINAPGATNSPQQVNVTLTVSNQPVLNANPLTLNFNYGAGGPMPAPQAVEVTGSAALPFTAADNADWLAVTPAAGTTPGSLSISVDPQGLAPGTYNGEVTVTAANAGNSPIKVNVVLTVAAAGPNFTADAVLNAASFAEGMPPAPGGLASVFGSFLDTPYTAAGSVPLPVDLAGVQVKLRNKAAGAGPVPGAAGRPRAADGDYIAAPLHFVFSSQINFQIPWGLQPGTAEMVVSVNGAESAPVEIQLGATGPGIFMESQHFTGPYAAIAYMTDGTLAWPAGSFPGATTRPVKIGEPLIILATGLGPVTGEPPVDGDDSIDDQGNWVRRDTATMPTVLVGGQPAPVFFAGLSPEFVGVYQINLSGIPATVQPGAAVPLVIEMNGVRSREDVFIAVDPAQ